LKKLLIQDLTQDLEKTVNSRSDPWISLPQSPAVAHTRRAPCITASCWS
jgi:hypothetical protein